MVVVVCLLGVVVVVVVSTGFAIRNSKGSKHVSKFVPSTARG